MIQREPVGEVMIIRLDRADKKNALTPEMMRDLTGAISTSLSARAIVLSGVGDVFCAGFDLALARDDAAALEALLVELASACAAVREAPCPVVCSAHGAAIAGGCALLAACDFAVADEQAKIGYPAVKLGISPAVSAPTLSATAGAAAARSRTLDPGLVTGLEAFRLQVISHLVATPRESEPRAIALAQELAAKPRHALGYTKRWLNELDGSIDPERSAAALGASLSGVGGEESAQRLAALWPAERRGGGNG